MATPNYTISLVASPIGGTAGLAAGTCLVYDSASTSYLAATTANRGTKRASGIAIGAAAVNGAVLMQSAGDIPSAISGLGAGAASWVRVSATGTLERVSPSGADDVCGWAEADGTVHLHFGFLTAAMIAGGGGTVPTGTGFSHVTAGALDAASKKVDLSAAADITNVLGTANGGSGSSTLSYPGGTDTVVGRASTDDLTNKRIFGGTGAQALSGRATQAMADANQTLAAAVYSRMCIKFTGNNTAIRTATFPAPATEDDSYVKSLENLCTTSATTISTGTGTTFNMGVGAKAFAQFSPSGAVAIASFAIA